MPCHFLTFGHGFFYWQELSAIGATTTTPGCGSLREATSELKGSAGGARVGQAEPTQSTGEFAVRRAGVSQRAEQDERSRPSVVTWLYSLGLSLRVRL